MAQGHDVEEGKGFAWRWSEVTRRLRFVIVLASVLSLGLAGVAVKLLERADGNFRLAHGSKSRQASKKLGTRFPALSRANTLVLLARVKNTGENGNHEKDLFSLGPAYCAWELAVRDAIEAEWPSSESESSSSTTTHNNNLVRSVTSFCASDAANETVLGAGFVDTQLPTLRGATSATIVVAYDAKAKPSERYALTHWIKRRARSLRDADPTLSSRDGGLAVGSTGLDPLLESGVKGTKTDLEQVDTRSLPIALGVMAWTLKSATLLVIPVLNMLFATVVEFAIMSVVATRYDIVAFAPSVMMTLTLAVSFDYGLFICSRYLEARRRDERLRNHHHLGGDAAKSSHRSTSSRVAVVLESAGHTIVVSGATLICCFLGLLLFSSSVLRGVGLAVSVGLSCALGFNLTLTPAILHIAGEPLCALQDHIDRRLISSLACFCCRSRRRRRRRRSGDDGGVLGDDDDDDDDDDDSREEEEEEDEASEVSGLHSRVPYVRLEDGDAVETTLAAVGADSSTTPGVEEEAEEDASRRRRRRRRCCPLSARPRNGRDASTSSSGQSSKTRRTRDGFSCPEIEDNVFAKLTRRLWDDRRLAIGVVLAVAAASTPSCRYCLSIRSIAEPTALSPSPTPPERVYRRVKDAFGGGSVAPYYVVVDVDDQDALSDASLDAVDGLLFGDLVDATDASAGPLLIVSPTRLGETVRLHAREYTYCLNHLQNEASPDAAADIPVAKKNASFSSSSSSSSSLSTEEQLLPLCPSIVALARDYVTPDRKSVVALVQLRSSAYSRAGLEWIGDARDAMQKSAQRAYFKKGDGPYLDGVAAQLADVIDGLYADFPVVVGVTLGVVFVLLGLAFRSVAVPARSVVALCLTLSFSFGSCVQVYQRRTATSPAFLSTRGDGKGLAWLSPLICFSIIVGLALDYDVFLLARVHEFRFGFSSSSDSSSRSSENISNDDGDDDDDGRSAAVSTTTTKRRTTNRLDDRDALLAAVSRTGVVITSAGVIMALSFGALFLSDSCVLNQCAYLLSVAVLYDTFVIRTLFMPSLISLQRGFAWWPTKPPPPLSLGLAGAADDDDHDHHDLLSGTSMTTTNNGTTPGEGDPIAVALDDDDDDALDTTTPLASADRA